MSELTEIEKIEAEYLTLVRDNKTGYFIPLKNTCNWLERMDLYNKYESNTQARKDFNRHYLRDPEYELVEAQKPEDEGDFIMIKNENNISFPWFSADGFKAICLILKSKKSSKVRKYFIQVEKKYWKALHQSEEENKKELEKLKENMQLMAINKENTLLAETIKERDELLTRQVTMHELKTFERHIQEIKTDKEAFVMSSNIGSMYYKSIEQLAMKEYTIYIIDPKNNNLKLSSDFEPNYSLKDNIDLETEEYLFIVTNKNLSSGDKVLDFYKFQNIGSVYIYNRDHHNSALEKIKEYNAGKMGSQVLYHCSISSIIDIFQTSLVELSYSKIVPE